jgi:hypothetical protein
MRHRANARRTRRTWLAGRVAVLLAVAAAGVLAVAHYSGWGAAVARAMHDPVAQASPDARVVARHAAQSLSPAMTAASTRPGELSSPAGSGPATTPQPRSAAPAASPQAAPKPTASPALAAAQPAAPAHFRTLPPGARLPSGAQCAKWVLAAPSPENKGMNKQDNRTTGQHVGAGFFPVSDGSRAVQLAARINGDFTGTTKEILRWASCKWGINQNIVFAQAAVESWWRQTTEGDWGTDSSACPPGHRQLNAQGECAQSYGILQNRYPYEETSWPGIGRSTAMNADTAYAIWRACYNGYETWLNTVPEPAPYHQGDAWGCVGRWFSGRWHTAAANGYITAVQKYMRERIWEKPYFQEP